MMEEKKIFNGKQSKPRKTKKQLMEIEEAEIENVPGIFSVLNENFTSNGTFG